MQLQKELEILKKYIGKDEEGFEKQFNKIKEHFRSDKDMQIIDEFIRNTINETTEDLKKFNEEMTLKIKLLEISDMISLSFIAKHYFKKSRSWLSQRINENHINGKPVSFTEKEKDTLIFALQDMSEKIGSVSASL